MLFVYFLCVLYVFQSIGMDIPAEYRGELMPRFAPSEQAAQYGPLKDIFPCRDLTQYAPELPLEKKSAFIECMNLLRADHLDPKILQYILDDPILVEAVITSTAHYEFRNDFIRLFFFGSILYGKPATYELLLEKKIDLCNIRSTAHETPAEFVRRLK